MAESQVVRSILALLRAHGHATKIHTGPYGQKGTPDIIGCVGDRAVVVEVKAEGGRLSAAQAEQLRRWSAAGALALVVTTVDEVEASLRGADLIH